MKAKHEDKPVISCLCCRIIKFWKLFKGTLIVKGYLGVVVQIVIRGLLLWRFILECISSFSPFYVYGKITTIWNSRQENGYFRFIHNSIGWNQPIDLWRRRTSAWSISIILILIENNYKICNSWKRK